MDAFIKAISSAGTNATLCRRLTDADPTHPVTPQIFNGWRRRGQVPENRVWQFCQATGIPPWELRPDIYDRPEVYLSKVAKCCSIEAQD